MFFARDRERPYTYGCLLADLHAWCEACGGEGHPHGLRVLGYNLSKAGNGEDITVAHGGWMSSAHAIAGAGSVTRFYTFVRLVGGPRALCPGPVQIVTKPSMQGTTPRATPPHPLNPLGRPLSDGGDSGSDASVDVAGGMDELAAWSDDASPLCGLRAPFRQQTMQACTRP